MDETKLGFFQHYLLSMIILFSVVLLSEALFSERYPT